ncbi:anti-sigma factor antagonist [Streptomyces sp. 142MFCol3.1]|uniref:anti-sigma factor antagonist n=1 Tax=Streptomyces sp. 142MFCol3.1 TaxID=1172179 RepID=UPI001EEADBD4|nr:anti-sigma factor antagonist [Streptomyces sp. 142MFCol3.1]
MSSLWLDVTTYAEGGRTVVAAHGEIDVDTEDTLRLGLREALDRSITGLDLDLSAVDFCDCSGLRVLTQLRQQALEHGKTLVLQAASPAVERLLTMTGTRCLFTTADSEDSRRDGGSALGAPESRRPASSNGSQRATTDLRTEVEQLRRAMVTRPVIDLARGVLMASFHLSPEDAWGVLVSVSQRTNTKLYRVAEGVLGSVDGHPLCEHMRQQLAAAVAAASPDGGTQLPPVDRAHPPDS